MRFAKSSRLKIGQLSIMGLQRGISYNVDVTMINYPFGIGLYQLSMVILGDGLLLLSKHVSQRNTELRMVFTSSQNKDHGVQLTCAEHYQHKTIHCPVGMC